MSEQHTHTTSHERIAHGVLIECARSVAKAHRTQQECAHALLSLCSAVCFQGFRAIRAGLTTDTYIQAMHCVPSKKSYALASAEADEATLEKIEAESKDPAIYAHMASSIAPEIFGHEDIKKALMLLLVVSDRDAHTAAPSFLPSASKRTDVDCVS